MSTFSVISGLLNNLARPFKASSTDELIVEMGGSSVGAFGDLISAEQYAVIQTDFVYGITTQIGTTAVLNSATADTNASRLRLQTGTNVAGSASYTSTKAAKYRQGQGITARFTPIFTTGVADSRQIAGMGTATDGYFFGFNGTAFGILHRNNTSDTWIVQTAWNNDKCDGTGKTGFNWNPTFGNVCQIRYPYLGFGAIKFYVQNSVDGSWILCHVIQYSNSTATTQLKNPNLNFLAQAVNTGNNTNLILYIGSIGVFINGNVRYLGSIFGASGRKTSITTQTNILTIRNATTYNGVVNKSLLRIKSISIAWDGGNGTCLLNVIKNTTLGGSPAFTPISGSTADNGVTITAGQSCASFDVAGTTITGGIIQLNTCSARNTGFFVDVIAFDLFIEAGSTITLAVTGDVSGDARVTINWVEDI